MKECRECHQRVSEQAFHALIAERHIRPRENGTGGVFEYKSEATLFGLPLLHISFKYRPNRMPVPAKGVIGIGQFGMGLINISQFGIGLSNLSQFAIAGFALAQLGKLIH
jgi:hypothetical protein